MSNNLNGVRIADSQTNGQHRTANEALNRLDAAVTDAFAVGVTSSNAYTVTAAELRNGFHFAIGNGATSASAATTITLPASVKRGLTFWRNTLSYKATLSISGQTAPADRGTVLRCVYESLALKYRYVNETINRVTGTETEAVHIVGGGSNNDMLNQFTADSVGVPVLAGPKEATAVGNLMVQAIGAGIIPDLKAAMPLIKSAFPIKTFKPQNTAAWDAAYARFTKLLK